MRRQKYGLSGVRSAVLCASASRRRVVPVWASAVGGVPCSADERGGGLSSIAPGASLLAGMANYFCLLFIGFCVSLVGVV